MFTKSKKNMIQERIISKQQIIIVVKLTQIRWRRLRINTVELYQAVLP